MQTPGYRQARFRTKGAAYLFYQDFRGNQAVLDAALPRRFDERRPEVMVHRFVQGQTLKLTEAVPLEIGMNVRVTRAPYLGQIGKITDLPHSRTPGI